MVMKEQISGQNHQQASGELTEIIKELKENNKFSSLLLDNSPMPILVINPDGSIRYVNKSTERLTGFTDTELMGAKPPYLFWPEDRKQEYMAELKNDNFGKKRVLEKTFVNKQGEEIWVEMNLIPVRINRQLKYVISTWTNLTEEKKLRRELQLYSQKIMEVREEERKRIAHELHDNTAQSLAIISMELDSLSRSEGIRSKKTLEKLNHLKEDAQRAMQNLRQYSYELRPGTLEHLGLIATLEYLVEETNQKSKTRTKFVLNGEERDIPDDVKIAFFRIAQEALNNMVTHSQATQSTVSLKFSPGKTQLKITDNGQGFNPDQERESALRGGSIGLVSMREWAKLIRADLKVESRPGKGTLVTAEVKL